MSTTFHIDKVPISVIEKLCPPCAEKMKAKHIKAVDFKQMPPQLLDGLCATIGSDPGFFSACVGMDFGDFNPGDRDSFCAWLHEQCTGEFPGAHEGKMRKAIEAKSVHAEGRNVIARISTEAVDRYGDVLVAQGCDATMYLANPVVMWAHDYAIPPIGKCVKFEKLDGEIVATTQFAERPKNHPESAEWFPDTVLSLFQQDILKGFSVGLESLEMRPATKADQQKYHGVRHVISRWNLLEYSVAPIPVNQDALAVAVSKGLIDNDCAKRLGFEAPKVKQLAVVLVSKRKTIDLDSAVKQELAKRRGALYYE